MHKMVQKTNIKSFDLSVPANLQNDWTDFNVAFKLDGICRFNVG